MKLKNSLEGNLWTQTIILIDGIIGNALQKIWDQAHKKLS